MGGKHGVFGFDVNAALARVRAAVIGSLTPRSVEFLPPASESLAWGQFVTVVEDIPCLTLEQKAMLPVVYLLGRASQEERSPLARLLRMKHAALGKLEEVGAALREQLAINEQGFERAFSLSKDRTKDEHDKRSHDDKAEEAAVRREMVELGDEDLCTEPSKHELICVWPRRMLSAIEELKLGFDTLDGKEFFSFYELLPSARKKRSMLLGECGAFLRGKEGQPLMEWPACAQLLLGDRKQHATVRNAVKRFRREDLAQDLKFRRLRDRALEVLEYPESRQLLGARHTETARMVREWDPSTASGAEDSKTESSARAAKRRGSPWTHAPRSISADVGSVSRRGRQGRRSGRE